MMFISEMKISPSSFVFFWGFLNFDSRTKKLCVNMLLSLLIFACGWVLFYRVWEILLYQPLLVGQAIVQILY